MTAPDLAQRPSWVARLWSWKAAVMLGRNTVVSTGVFLIGLGLLWWLVEIGHVDKLVATAASFLLANSLHYVVGRAWIYRGTSRSVAPGYALFLVNAALGLAVTLILFGAMMRYTEINYLLARILVSVVAGLVMFVLNATLNFGRL
ncbi:MAG: GtrA family protein [Sphingomicrobium sp.]